ncbi:MAG: inorganic diphosphatase [Candidatus Hodarchaeaceae archaeon]|nr:inorganic diphosphatase [Candidatus Hodarchaeaceae archaeon]
MVNLWKEIKQDKRAPRIVDAVVEVPKLSRNKYEYDKETGVFRLDRVLHSPLHYPVDYGFIPMTYEEDGDPVDVMVFGDEPSFQGSVLKVRPIGLLRMLDEGRPDDKILAVPLGNPRFARVRALRGIPAHLLKELTHFFSVYKELEGKETKVLEWRSADAARQVVARALKQYKKKFR